MKERKPEKKRQEGKEKKVCQILHVHKCIGSNYCIHKKKPPMNQFKMLYLWNTTPFLSKWAVASQPKQKEEKKSNPLPSTLFLIKDHVRLAQKAYFPEFFPLQESVVMKTSLTKDIRIPLAASTILLGVVGDTRVAQLVKVKANNSRTLSGLISTYTS